MPDSPTINAEPSIERQSTGRRTEDARRDYLARLLSQMPEAIVCFDREWRITFANAEAHRVSRIKPVHLNGKSHWELFPEMVGTQLERTYRAVMQSGVPAHIEYFCKPYDVWLDTHVFPMEDGIAVYFRDITDRKGAELLRDAASNQLMQVLEATTDAVASVDRSGKFTFLNRRARELLAVKGDLIGKNLFEEFPADLEQGGYLYHFNRAMYEGIPGDFEDYYPAPLNMWLSIQVRPSTDGVVIFFRNITERRRAYHELQFQQELLNTVQQTARVATWDIDIATGKATYGPGSYPVFGHPLAELPDLNSFTKIVLPEYVPIIDRLIKTTVATGEMIVVDCPMRAADGSIIWIESRGHAVQVDGVSTRLRGLSIDITDRKHNEDALITSEARYRILADLNPQAIWMGTPDGRITYANQGLLDYLGFTPEDFEGERWLKGFHPDDRASVIEQWSHSVATGLDYDLEARMIRARDGRARWWWIRAQPVRDDHGNILHWLGVNIDIDDRKTFAEMLQQRQEETERQRAELETIYETAPVGLALFDPVEFRYLRVNTRQAETIGLPKDQIIGRRITEIAPLKGLPELFQQVAAGHPVRNHLLEGELSTRPGEHRSWNVSYSPIYDANGHVEAIAAVVLEITNQRKAEAALMQSEKLAAVGRLASSISHEINNPLEAITNLLYLIATSDTLPADVADYVATAQSELSRVCQIATQTLRFHRQAVRASDVTPAELVDAVINLYQGRLANSGITVEATYETDSTLHCFENDIRQVLNNLIANAIDAMRPSGGRLIIRAHDATDHPTDRKGVRITIADTGHGMSPAVRARIFEPFFTTKDLNGTGLGLWISTGIVNRHQGRLTLRSTEHPIHHGTIFSLFLPYEETPEA
ncbi:PAS domain S-box-containing protein [Edaphobacter aggregans]|uniref:histidine kinase n=1 Tax=Edaphobacter aggregans TaxID=570835 RepID=A0A428MIH4_9BACT|nr:PAS domain-containing protein [Edaphobacter aggregans]RSL16721.1 PAS domain S-box-containing protein [Edaphobacter aggregans]